MVFNKIFAGESKTINGWLNETKMEINKKYVVYELNNVMGSERHKALEKVEFKGWKSNSFDTEEEAIQALIDDEKTYEDYVILKHIYIS